MGKVDSSSFKCALETKWQAKEKRRGKRKTVSGKEEATEKLRETWRVERY